MHTGYCCDSVLTLMCSWSPNISITHHISSRFSRNSERFASKFLQNLEHSALYLIISQGWIFTTLCCVARMQRVGFRFRLNLRFISETTVWNRLKVNYLNKTPQCNMYIYFVEICIFQTFQYFNKVKTIFMSVTRQAYCSTGIGVKKYFRAGFEGYYVKFI